MSFAVLTEILHSFANFTALFKSLIVGVTKKDFGSSTPFIFTKLLETTSFVFLLMSDNGYPQ